MLEIAKLAVFCAVVWVMWLAIPIAAALVGTVLALWILYFFSKVATEELDDDDGNRPESNGSDQEIDRGRY